MIRRMAPTWGAVIIAALLLLAGVWSTHRQAQAREAAVCTLITASERIINGLLALPGANDPRLAENVADYRQQLEDLEAARGRLAGGC